MFKLKAPRNLIAGGGIFAHYSRMPLSLAWEAFGEANGAASREGLRERILRALQEGPSLRRDFPIGCRVLTQPFFLDEEAWFPPPPDWSPNIVSLKTYDTGTDNGRRLWDAVNERVQRHALPGEEARFGRPRIITPRLGQGAFRAVVTDVYERRCAVTGERTLPALDAAHIRPYGMGGAHEARNGLLLRRDLHKLFDDGYVTVTPDHHFEVSGRIREEFENGRHYYALHGKAVFVPGSAGLKPDRAELAWHNENRFMG